MVGPQAIDEVDEHIRSGHRRTGQDLGLTHRNGRARRALGRELEVNRAARPDGQVQAPVRPAARALPALVVGRRHLGSVANLERYADHGLDWPDHEAEGQAPLLWDADRHAQAGRHAENQAGTAIAMDAHRPALCARALQYPDAPRLEQSQLGIEAGGPFRAGGREPEGDEPEGRD